MKSHETMYQYRESGLENVYLVNGVRKTKTPYGDAIAIVDQEGLHAVIGKALCEKPNRLTGREFRFLRHELDQTQKCLGELLGVGVKSIESWESAKGGDKPIPNDSANRLVRLLYREAVDGSQKVQVRALLRRLVELDRREQVTELVLEEHDGRWEANVAA
jgi:DNA-binding transcriptional regulator YiaG